MINWEQNFVSSNSVCNHTRDYTNRTPATRSSDFVNHSYDYRPNWTSLSPVTITYYCYYYCYYYYNYYYYYFIHILYLTFVYSF